jgi:hypothetical protein
VSVSWCSEYENGIIALECECDGVRVSARGWNECDKVALGDSSFITTSIGDGASTVTVTRR